MEIREYIRILLKRGWIIVLLAVVVAGGAIAVSKLQRPTYRATLYLNVVPVRLDYSVQQTIKNMLRNYARQITSDSTLSRVNDQLQLDMSPDALRADMSVSPVESDFLLQIAVENYDPIVAKSIADTTADIFVADITARMLDQDKQDRVDVFVNDYAQPGSLYKPKWKILGLAGGVLGSLLGLLVVFLLEWVDADVIRSRQDVERSAGVPVMGVVPAIGRAARVSAGEAFVGALSREFSGVRDQAQSVLKYAWIVALLAVITAASAIVFSKLQRPVYRATLYLNAIPARLEWGVQQTIQGMLRNYGRQITSDQMLARVDQQLALDMPPNALRENLTVDPIESDLLIQIAVESYDPMVAKNIADTAADIFVQDISTRMLDQDRQDRVDVSVSDYARPGSLFKPKWKINALAGAVLGGLIGLVIVFFLRWLESDIVRSEDDVTRYLGIPVLGSIPVLDLPAAGKEHGARHAPQQRPAESHLTLDSRS